MGLLDSVIGGVLGQVLGGRGGAASPLVKALLMLLLTKGAAGGFGDIFGGGHRGSAGPDDDRSAPSRPRGGPETEDIGGYDQRGGRRDAPGRHGDGGYENSGYGDDPRAGDLPDGDYSDLAGMLDGPGEAGAPRQRAPRGEGGEPDLGGFDGLVDRFRRGGLGDVVESWIGHGANRPVAPDQLARVLGDGAVGALQARTGLDRETLLAQLAQALPEVVHALTPQGRVPAPEERRGW